MLPPADLAEILSATRPLWEDLRGGRLFITGGTGFFGRWLLESFVHANREMGLGAQAVVLTRDPTAFRARQPHLAAMEEAIELLAGDVCDFAFPDGKFTHVIHAATEVSGQPGADDPLRTLDVTVGGTRRALDFCRASGARRFLLTSSGAVYGKQPSELTHVPETYLGAPDPTLTSSAYGEGKRMAELLCACYGKRYGLETVSARCFAFVGPGLPLDVQFAVGNFLRDALAGGPIRIGGDGTPHRSYQYAADLAAWLWTLLFRGAAGRAYNVGSEESVSIAELAGAVARAVAAENGSKAAEILIAQQPSGAEPLRYVPSTQRAREELGLGEGIKLAEGLRRTVAFLRAG